MRPWICQQQKPYMWLLCVSCVTCIQNTCIHCTSIQLSYGSLWANINGNSSWTDHWCVWHLPKFCIVNVKPCKISTFTDKAYVDYILASNTTLDINLGTHDPWKKSSMPIFPTFIGKLITSFSVWMLLSYIHRIHHFPECGHLIIEEEFVALLILPNTNL